MERCYFCHDSMHGWDIKAICVMTAHPKCHWAYVQSVLEDYRKKMRSQEVIRLEDDVMGAALISEARKIETQYINLGIQYV